MVFQSFERQVAIEPERKGGRDERHQNNERGDAFKIHPKSPRKRTSLRVRGEKSVGV